MTTTGKDTASFFENGTTDQFEYCFKLYPQVLKLKAEKRNKKPQELIRLDQWYQNELPKLIKGRGKDAHMVYDELVQTMKWKQSRGKFYPQLSYLVKVNTPRAVMQETKKAFRKLPNLEQAITALSNLKGVGTTMASALLAAAAPHSAPFMADECLMAIPEIEGIDYTTKEYLNFVQHIQSTVERLNTEAGGDIPFWSPHRVELALWSHYVANDLSPELLDEMPGPGSGGGGGANTNGSTVKPKGTVTTTDGNNSKVIVDGGSEDTNDGDDESLGTAAARGEINNIATESETDNDNTNPANFITPVSAGVLQDGDSNFVSNDSTSQEPIIDENTTQTTATTSTDDGEVGTPLASDSESNLEAPQQKQQQQQQTPIQPNQQSTLTKIESAKIKPEPVATTAAIETEITKTAVAGGKAATAETTSASVKSTNIALNEINNSGDATDEEISAVAATATATVKVATDSVTSVTPAEPILPNKLNNQQSSISINNSNSSDSGSVVSDNDNVKDLTTAVGNGNGTLLGVSGGSVSDSLDGENSNCLLPSKTINNIDAATDDDDDEDDIRMVADESSNSNSRSGGGSVGIENKTATTSIKNSNDVNKTDNDSTLSGTGIPLGQKRALNCSDAAIATAAVIAVGTLDEQQPDMKKIRSE